jgi:hypothetical protein
VQLIAKDGEIYAHLFDNPPRGLARDLYWNIHVELEPVYLLGEEWVSVFQCDWLVWPIKTLRDLDGMGLEQVRYPKLVEASVYLVSEHHPAAVSHLVVRRIHGNGYHLDARGAVEVDMDGQQLSSSFHFECSLSFSGIVVVPENVSPKPSNRKEVAMAVAPFISLVGLKKPRREGFRYVLDAEDIADA